MEALQWKKLGVEVGKGFPAGLVVGGPRDQGLDLTAAEAGVKHFFDILFLSMIGDAGRRRPLSVARKRVGVDRLEERDVEDGVDFHGCREVEAVGVRANSFRDGPLPKVLVVELEGGVNGVDVFPKEAH